MRSTVGFALALALFGWGCVFCHCLSPAEQQAIVQTTENAEAVTQYKLILADCRARGRDAGSYAVYQECADAIDADLCRRRSLRCDDAGAR